MDSPTSVMSLGLTEEPPLENETFDADEFFSAPVELVELRLHRPDGRRSSPSPPPPSETETGVPLRRWIRDEDSTTAERRLHLHPSSTRRSGPSIVVRTAVAYAIGELLLRAKHCRCSSPPAAAASSSSSRGGVDDRHALLEEFSLDNFVVRVANSRDARVEGVDMISPSMSLRIISPFFLSDEFWNDSDSVVDGRQEELGRFLEVEIQGGYAENISSSESPGGEDVDELALGEESKLCHSFGVLLYELYSETIPFSSPSPSLELDNHDSLDERDLAFTLTDDGERSLSEREPLRKKTLWDLLSFKEETNGTENDGSLENMVTSHAHAASVNKRSSKFAPLKELGFPVSISLLVKSLLDCGWDEFHPDDAMPSLKAAKEDLHLMLLDPSRFLFDKVLSRGVATLDIKKNKLYGRDAERSLITEIFCRVSLRGESEVLFIDGFSGSGKSKLVQSVVEYIDVFGGYITQTKFDQISQERPTSVVIAAFDNLCPLIRRKNSPMELEKIVADLKAVFGARLSTLARLLPSAALLIPELNAVSFDRGKTSEINLTSIYFTLQLFMRVVSSKTHPVMIFLDDLQWADSASLDVLQHILADIKGSSCIYIVGSYRGDQVSKDHAIFRLMSDLETFNIRLSKVHLDGMDIVDVNNIISDALGIVPRICKPLSELVLRKTKGNPLFVSECLRSLVDRDLLQYSIRERCWIWDTDQISADAIADNVGEFLSIKMMLLPETAQQALEISSCFGTTINSEVVKTLMLVPEFSSLQKELKRAVDDGFMDKNEQTSSYRFVHDKVQEAAYGLIPEGERDQFHHNIGMTLLRHGTQGADICGMIFVIVDQINHVTIQDFQQRITVAQLNCRAASRAMGNSNSAAAYFYSNAAIKLLPKNHWDSHYDLSRSIFLVLGNAAYTDGHIEEASSALDKILSHGKSLEDKLDAYYLKIRLMHAHQEGKAAYDTCIEVLRELGETIPASVKPEIVVQMVENIQSKLNETTDSDFMATKSMDSPFHCSLMRFYSQVSFLSYFVNTPMFDFFACKLVEISLEHGFCKYSALGIMQYSAVLVRKIIHDVQGGYRVGKMALKLLDRFDATDILPHTYLVYYGFIAVHIEPLQSCTCMLKRGFVVGLSTGDRQMALMNGVHYIQISLFSGTNLSILKEECDYQMRLNEHLFQPMTKMYVTAWQETLSMLTTKKVPSSSNLSDEEASKVMFHRVLQNFWLGRYDRCLYYAEKSLPLYDSCQLKSILIIFYRGLSCFHSKRTCGRRHMKLAHTAIGVMKEKGEISSWNYQCKIHLLEAEIFSATAKKDRAKVSFHAAISAARSSKFVHEQGLACELAALHCIKYGDIDDATDLLEQAIDCYTKWGSQVKIDCITKQLEKIANRKG